MYQFLPRKLSPQNPHHEFDRRVFLVIEMWYFSNETPLSVRQICAKLGNIAPSTVHRSLTRLEAAGYTRRDAQGVLRLTDKRWKD